MSSPIASQIADVIQQVLSRDASFDVAPRPAELIAAIQSSSAVAAHARGNPFTCRYLAGSWTARAQFSFSRDWCDQISVAEAAEFVWRELAHQLGGQIDGALILGNTPSTCRTGLLHWREIKELAVASASFSEQSLWDLYATVAPDQRVYGTMLLIVSDLTYWRLLRPVLRSPESFFRAKILEWAMIPDDFLLIGNFDQCLLKPSGVPRLTGRPNPDRPDEILVDVSVAGAIMVRGPDCFARMRVAPPST